MAVTNRFVRSYSSTPPHPYFWAYPSLHEACYRITFTFKGRGWGRVENLYKVVSAEFVGLIYGLYRVLGFLRESWRKENGVTA